jgi:hypothetical protein
LDFRANRRRGDFFVKVSLFLSSSSSSRLLLGSRFPTQPSGPNPVLLLLLLFLLLLLLGSAAADYIISGSSDVVVVAGKFVLP